MRPNGLKCSLSSLCEDAGRRRPRRGIASPSEDMARCISALVRPHCVRSTARRIPFESSVMYSFFFFLFSAPLGILLETSAARPPPWSSLLFRFFFVFPLCSRVSSWKGQRLDLRQVRPVSSRGLSLLT